MHYFWCVRQQIIYIFFFMPENVFFMYCYIFLIVCNKSIMREEIKGRLRNLP